MIWKLSLVLYDDNDDMTRMTTTTHATTTAVPSNKRGRSRSRTHKRSRSGTSGSGSSGAGSRGGSGSGSGSRRGSGSVAMLVVLLCRQARRDSEVLSPQLGFTQNCGGFTETSLASEASEQAAIGRLSLNCPEDPFFGLALAEPSSEGPPTEVRCTCKVALKRSSH